MPAPNLVPVRAAHRFDEATLTAHLQQHVEGIRGPIEFLQFEGGQSNPTFLLRNQGRAYVLRKQPPGELLPSAHQVDREYRVMHALAGTAVPVPRMLNLCMDPGVIGTRFYLMEAVDGRVVGDPLMPGFTPAERGAVWDDLARVLAELHKVEPAAVGLGDFGRPGNYYARQIKRWSQQYEASKTESIAAMDDLMRWLPERIPASNETVIAHGDYRLGNVMLHPTEPRIVAVLDWELCTLGHPLADLGYLCQDFRAPSYDGAALGDAPLAELGIPDEAAFVAAYCRYAGRAPIANWTFYLVYNLFRSAAIIQGVYKRGLDGNASSASALGYAPACRLRSERAWQLVQAAGLA